MSRPSIRLSIDHADQILLIEHVHLWGNKARQHLPLADIVAMMPVTSGAIDGKAHYVEAVERNAAHTLLNPGQLWRRAHAERLAEMISQRLARAGLTRA